MGAGKKKSQSLSIAILRWSVEGESCKRNGDLVIVIEKLLPIAIAPKYAALHARSCSMQMRKLLIGPKERHRFPHTCFAGGRIRVGGSLLCC
jgi:hypothetical protein